MTGSPALANEDLRDPRVLGAMRRSVLAGLQRRPDDARLVIQLVRLTRALGDLQGAARACAEYLRVHGAHAGMQRLRGLLGGDLDAGLLAGAGPAPFLALENVLSAADQAAVWSSLEGARAALAPATVKWHGGEGVVGEVRLSLRMPAPAAVLERLVPALRDAIERRGLVEAFRLGRRPLGNVESEVVCHTEGGRFGRHTDDAYGSGPRVLTCVYYLHHRPARFTGGDLLLHDIRPAGGSDDPIAFTRFPPADNTVVIFPADVGHEVTEVRSDAADALQGRVSINVWFHAPGAGSTNAEAP
jgi:hypothetical protein